MLSEENKKKLLTLARDTILSFFDNKEPNLAPYEEFNTAQGVFVTLHKKGQLRGCIGFPQATHPLNKATIHAAKAAAFQDPRFVPVREEEMSVIKIEISVLTVPKEIIVKSKFDYPKHIKIGEDGLIIKNSLTSGLLLPQVFTDYNCTPKEALEMTCQKANLAKDDWKKQDIKIFKFQAQIFSE